MKKLLVVGAVVFLGAGAALAHKPDKSNHKKEHEFAQKCTLAALSSGAYETMDVITLGTYCVDLAKLLAAADYSPAP